MGRAGRAPRPRPPRGDSSPHPSTPFFSTGSPLSDVPAPPSSHSIQLDPYAHLVAPYVDGLPNLGPVLGPIRRAVGATVARLVDAAAARDAAAAAAHDAAAAADEPDRVYQEIYVDEMAVLINKNVMLAEAAAAGVAIFRRANFETFFSGAGPLTPHDLLVQTIAAHPDLFSEATQALEAVIDQAITRPPPQVAFVPPHSG